MSKKNNAHYDRKRKFAPFIDTSSKEFWACGRKKAYASERRAEQEIANLTADGIPQAPLRTYKCPHCKQYHLTHERNL